MVGMLVSLYFLRKIGEHPAHIFPILLVWFAGFISIKETDFYTTKKSIFFSRKSAITVRTVALIAFTHLFVFIIPSYKKLDSENNHCSRQYNKLIKGG